MSNINIARRTAIKVFFAGADISSEIEKYLISLTFTDNEEDQTDDLQIKLEDKDSIWLTKWLNTIIQAAASTPSVKKKDEKERVKAKPYTVVSAGGVNVRSRPGTQYYSYGTLPYGTNISVFGISNGWANFMYSGKNAYVIANSISASDDNDSLDDGVKASKASKGLKIQAVIIRQNWKSDGKDEILECGQFELDDISCSGPPATITIKGTSLPYNNSIRQTLKSRSWESYTLMGIANEIAQSNGMSCMYLCDKMLSFKRVEQYKKSDIAFLQKLCHDSGLSLKISNNIVIIFDQQTYEAKPSIRTIQRGKSGGYSKYKLATESNDTYASCCVTYTMPNDGTVIKGTAYTDDYDAENKNNQCLRISQKVSNIAEANSLAEKMLRLHNKYEFSASFTFPGDTSLVAGSNVKLTGWGAWSGKYIIEQAKHTVSGSGYATQINLRRAYDIPASTTNNNLESLDAVALEVIQGKWGNGNERKQRLTEAGYNYVAVQERVNEMLS